MFFQGHDAYCLQKRTNMINWAPFLNPADRLGVDYLEYPQRMIYPPNELISNPVGYESGVTKLGGPDEVVTSLKMNGDLTYGV